MEIKSIKNFYTPNFFDRILLNFILDKNYKKYYSDKKGYNYPIYDNVKSFEKLYELFLKDCKLLFGDFDLSPKNQKTCHCYRSKRNDYRSIFHDHERTSTINGVYYYDIEMGDSISFLNSDKEHIYYPDKNELLIFPGHLIHKPNRPVGNAYRYSINMEIITIQSANEIFNEK
jgi:hypothetical protein